MGSPLEFVNSKEIEDLFEEQPNFDSDLLYDQLPTAMDSSSQVTVSTAAPLQITVSTATPSQVTVSAAAPSQVTVSADVPVLESASSVAPRLESANEPNAVILKDDQRFLLYFIMGAYFGPDLKGEPKKSVFQRMAEGLPPYTLDQVAGSHMKMVEVERVYYYVLQKADQSLAVKFPLLDEFLKGTLNSGCESTASHPQFPDLFPPEMHPHSKFRNRYKIIGNIVFINNPEISYLKPEDIERFKRLTGVEDLLLSRDATRFHPQQDGSKLYNVPIKEAESHGESSPSLLSNTSRRKRRIDDIVKSKEQKVHDDTPLDSKPQADPTMINNANYLEGADPTLLFLPSRPTKQEWAAMTAASKTGVVLTGSAAMGNAGSVIGLVDIGECEDSYMFRVVLTGVNRDEREFTCQVEPNGKVFIKGVTTTGEKTVYKYNQLFIMQSQNLCPPGDFTISFELPGPVDPKQFYGNFGDDGILEGIVTKRKHSSKEM